MAVELPQYRKDVNDVAMLGADVGLYMDFWEFFSSIEGNEDTGSTRFFNSLHDIANLVRKIQEKSA